MIMIHLATICPHTKLLQYYWAHSFMLLITLPWLIYNWKFVSLNILYLFHLTWHLFNLWQILISSLHLWVCLHLISFAFSVLDSKHKWDNMIFVFLWLVFLSLIPSRTISMLSQVARFLFPLCLSNIPFCVYIPLFNHSSIDRHLGCFHILATGNNVTINIGVHVSLWMGVFVCFG